VRGGLPKGSSPKGSLANTSEGLAVLAGMLAGIGSIRSSSRVLGPLEVLIVLVVLIELGVGADKGPRPKGSSPKGSAAGAGREGTAGVTKEPAEKPAPSGGLYAGAACGQKWTRLGEIIY